MHSYMNGDHERRAREILASKTKRADLDLLGSLAADARVRALQHGLRQRLCAAADGRPISTRLQSRLGRARRALPGLSDPFRRRARLGRDGGGVSGAARRIRARRAARSSPPTSPSASASISVVSYDMGGTTAKICLIENFEPRTARSVRGRAHLSLRQGLGHADLDSRHRDDRDRRRRRLDRLDRRDGPHPDRAGKRGLGTRPRLLSARRNAADDHRRRSRARQDRRREFRRRRDPAFASTSARAAIAAACRRTARA